MSWYFLNSRCENSHCSPERVVEYLEGNCSHGVCYRAGNKHN